jgi:DNA-binding response OmpR family regulator
MRRYVPGRKNHPWERLRVLLAEHDPRVSAIVEDALVSAGFTLVIARTGEVTTRLLETERFDAAILDLEMPDSSGLQTAASLVGSRPGCSILLISGLDNSSPCTCGYAVPANDYVIKPFHPDVIVSRLRAFASRPGGGVDSVLRFGDLKMDQVRSVAWRNGKRLPLTPPEFELLRQLMRRGGESETMSYFVRRVVGDFDDACERHLAIHIAHLRRKLTAAQGPQLVLTDKGGGLRLVPAVFGG